jgi:hypothetical protein
VAFLSSFNVKATVPYSMTSFEPDPKGNIFIGVCSLDATASHMPVLIFRISKEELVEQLEVYAVVQSWKLFLTCMLRKLQFLTELQTIAHLHNILVT